MRGRKMQSSTKHRKRDLATQDSVFSEILSSSFFPRLAFRSCEEKEAMARFCQADQRKMDSCKGSEMDKIIKTTSKVME